MAERKQKFSAVEKMVTAFEKWRYALAENDRELAAEYKRQFDFWWRTRYLHEMVPTDTSNQVQSNDLNWVRQILGKLYYEEKISLPERVNLLISLGANDA